MKRVETRTVEVQRNVCDWCGVASQSTLASIYVRGNYAEPTVPPWWKRSASAFVGFFPTKWRLNEFKYDVHVACVEEIVDRAIQDKARLR